MASAESDATPVVLSGPVTLYESSEVRELLASALAHGRGVRIDLETSGPWDLSGFQLLISAVTSGDRAGQPVRLANVPGVCVEIAERSGLRRWLDEASDSFL